jgi:hypothetical protein
MKRNSTTKVFLAGAAMAGLISGGLVSTSRAAEPSVGAGAPAPAEKEKGETHACKGHNSCKGKGGCKSGDNGCAGKNSCKGKGGCAVKDGKPAH